MGVECVVRELSPGLLKYGTQVSCFPVFVEQILLHVLSVYQSVANFQTSCVAKVLTASVGSGADNTSLTSILVARMVS
jgi:hypothetical protein